MSEIQHPKVVVVGAGSLFFGRQSIWQMVHSPHLNKGTLALDTHELTAEAVAKCDFGSLRRAMLTDPLVSSIADADAIIRELLEAERDALPACWQG
jgi:alpha-galactosidase/6-phospho-beta-glucosidase family protein